MKGVDDKGVEVGGGSDHRVATNPASPTEVEGVTETKTRTNEVQQPSVSTGSRAQWIQFLEDVGKSRTRARTQTQNSKRRILLRVPEKIKQRTKDFKSYYEPSAVSIGPYHHGNAKLKEVEDLKPIIANLFLHQYVAVDVRAGVFFNNFAEEIKGYGAWYETTDLPDGVDEEKFVRMMFLDACFIYMFVNAFVFYDFEELGLKKNVVEKVYGDLLLLENQLPFPVLELLYTLAHKTAVEHTDGVDEKKFVRNNVFSLIVWFGAYISDTILRLSEFDIEEWGSFIAEVLDKNKPLHLLDILQRSMFGTAIEKHETPISVGGEREMRGRLFRNVKELKSAGIHLKPSKKTFLKEVSFTPHCFIGKLTIPRINIDGLTRLIFLNLIAYEACEDRPTTDFGFTSYICFLNSLIDDADDVQAMRSAGILDHFLDSDKEVAKLINDISADLVPEIDTYGDIKRNIRNYFNHRHQIKVATWVAEVIHDHFRSPWTVIAVFAATLLISLTIVQTYFTIFPRK